MATEAIDWNEIWKRQRGRRSVIKRDVNFWDEKARSLFKKPWESNYPEDFLKTMEPKRYWTVLDMACGTGALAIPLSKCVRKIVAVDFSPGMLEVLEEQCRMQEINNIAIIKASWEDNWESKGIGEYDVVVASRCLIVDDLQEAIMKLHNAALERVYISTIVGDGPHDRRMHEATGKRLLPGPDYIYTYNVLHQMGIHANVSFIKDLRQESFYDRDEAFQYYGKFLGKLTGSEKVKLRHYLEDHLVIRSGRWVLDYERITQWAVMWWDKK